MKIGKLNKAISVVLLATAAGPGAFSTARAVTSGEGDKQSSEQSAERSGSDPEAVQLDTIQVTGTRIRGGVTPSPVVTIGIESIREEGFKDLGEVIRSIPQNFGGGQNPGVIPFTVSGAGAQNTNLSGGSALNLRGLGADATLTLLNGRRMAYDGISQAVDISAIPVEAVERIEIVADGASAIYGSDAVGGVGNVILRRDFEGVTLGTGYGTSDDGGLTTREYSATAGHVWSTGGVIVTYKDVTADPIYARQRAYTQLLREPYTLYPGSDLRSGLVSLSQAVGEHAELRLDAFRTERSQAYGAQDNLSDVSIQATPESATTLLSPRLDIFLQNDWTLSLGATRSRSRLDHTQSITLPASGLVLQRTQLCYCNEGSSYEAGVEGPLLALAAGDVRVAVGAGRRENTFLEYNQITHVAAIEGDEAAQFAYAELQVPVLDGGGAGQRLSLTGAARYEDYDSFGSVLTPKLGAIYSPIADVTLKASWGRSFKAPTLFQLNRQQMTGFNYAAAYGGTGYAPDATVLLLDGGNPDLAPERARTWTTSVAFHPTAVPGLEAELTWFDIDYSDRVVAPITPTSQALRNPAFAEFVTFSPSAEQQAAAIAGTTFLNYIGVPYDPSDVVALVHAYYTNVARQRIRGLDMSGAYGLDLGGGRLTVRGAASWLASTQQTTDAEFDLAGTIHNPSKLTGRVGTVWARGGFSASAFANYRQGVENVAASEKTASFTTVDTTLRYAPDGEGSVLRDWALALSVQNVFDRAPPLHDTSVLTPYLVPPYDATNYSAIGRYFNVSVSRQW
ncbi:TonB-dependent receptor plug domain-containing protein [Luteimonas terrae]|uniref:Outer membrane receptor protein involved in Fe transport n=1 Tax=Luteimonas terrae TaxID=1530191 RepID=A0ABU1XWZ5_9GAMM|nr:TonB-dependent receptor [Luteimonas terrae]MDR7193278.1 outer membrane receptor protein involved in Fe transport [Luteimonas terrae]